MASGGPPSTPSPSSWAEIAAAIKNRPSNPSPLVEGPVLRKLKASTSEFIHFDSDSVARAHLRFQHSLIGKFFGKPPIFEQIKTVLLTRWQEFGEISISDLPNGYLLFRCESHEVSQKLLFEGPWGVNGVVLQLAPWKPFFEPAFAKLSSDVVWVQLHNLPVEFWDGESLEFIASSLGTLLKIDEFTCSLSRSKYARICVEIDLNKPLKQGFWVGDDAHRVFVVVLYEKLPTFCYHCGLVGHGSNQCNRRSSMEQSRSSPPPYRVHSEPKGKEAMVDLDPMNDGSEARTDQMTPEGTNYNNELEETPFGPWMIVSRGRGRGEAAVVPEVVLGSSRSRAGRMRSPSRLQRYTRSVPSLWVQPLDTWQLLLSRQGRSPWKSLACIGPHP
ncbi:uncharacterized protein LOC120273995 [Dioscorea cayenensis subsp. rotundata]|uniref:Uncharacterized protein LOC120273995 n=1 Tax=Dioscorea cayennensis subsp. rotundata TaxID=55577 RepID=A0AB40CC46_DIOCR|nr:uncharacterized protein LOC120273995 [Dioscorea cayenensis subsp. rotundata]